MWAGTVVVAVALAVGLFFVVPVGLTSLIKDQLNSSFLFWLAASAFITSFWFALGNLAPRARAGLVSDGQRMLSIKGLSADAVPVPLPPAGDIESSGSSVAPPAHSAERPSQGSGLGGPGC